MLGLVVGGNQLVNEVTASIDWRRWVNQYLYTTTCNTLGCAVALVPLGNTRDSTREVNVYFGKTLVGPLEQHRQPLLLVDPNWILIDQLPSSYTMYTTWCIL